MYPFRADLHCHSLCSDGTDSPETLLDLAKRLNLQGLSITDHDTLSAYTEALFERAKELEIELIVGVEISSVFREKNIHILAYGMLREDPSFLAFLEEIQKRRQERNVSILAKLRKHQMPIDEEKILLSPTAGRPHIAQEMVVKGYVGSVQEAFDRYLKDGGSCYEMGFKRSSKEVIEAIQKANGKAILAHPHFYPEGLFLQNLLSLPFDGIECYYGLLSEARIKPWINRAKEKNLLITGGSDYHGKVKPKIQLGCSFVDEECFRALQN